MAKALLRKVRDVILRVVDFFYPPFSRLLPRHTFRYLACGGSNTLLDIFLYYCSYHYVVQGKEVSVFGLFNISPHIMAFILAFSVTFPIGFTLSKYIVFPESQLRGRVQLFRYAMLVAVMLGMNYVLLKFFVEILYFYPTLAKIVTTIFVAIFSYFSQKKVAFKFNQNTETESE